MVSNQMEAGRHAQGLGLREQSPGPWGPGQGSRGPGGVLMWVRKSPWLGRD
jgi:hypothetical protein